MSIAYLVGKFGSGLAPGTVPAPAPITGHAVIRYTTLLQLNTSPGQLIPVTPVRLPIVDGVLCSATGVPSTTTPIAVQATDDPLLAQSGAVFAQIDLIFDGGSEPVQAVLALPGGMTVDVATAARAGGPGAVFVSGLAPNQLTELDAGLAEVESSRAAAAAAQTAAEAAAAQAVAVSTSNLDPAAAVLVAAPASLMRAQLDILLGALAAQSASIEDLFVSVTLAPPSQSITINNSIPVLTAPFPLAITSIALTQWGAAIPLNDASYWTVIARTQNVAATLNTPIATKSTKTTAAGAIPAGTVVPSRGAWTFDAAQFTTPNLAPGETLNIAFTPTGTPGAFVGPVMVTVGYRPL